MSPSVNKSLFMKCLTKEEREEFLWGRQTAVREGERQVMEGLSNTDFLKPSEFIPVQILIRIVPRERKQRKEEKRQNKKKKKKRET